MYGILLDSKRLLQFVTPLQVVSNQPETVVDSMSLDRKSSRKTAQRWEITANIEPTSKWANYLMVHTINRGHSGVLVAIMPQNISVINNRKALSTTISAVGNQFSTQVQLTGVDGLIPAGCFIRFATHSKIYMATTYLATDGILNIYPPLLLDVTGVIKYRDDVQMVCKYDTDTIIGMRFEDGVLMDLGAVKLIESNFRSNYQISGYADPYQFAKSSEDFTEALNDSPYTDTPVIPGQLKTADEYDLFDSLGNPITTQP